MKIAGNEANSEKEGKRSDGDRFIMFLAGTREMMVHKWSSLEKSTPINSGWLNRGLDQVVKDGLFLLGEKGRDS
ncbi:hypothetical protein J1N35_019515 [Gossypium stocksii]|uniref:Uncharacterized protein n=1 Tax=Gossypium stocksii TaxID=47602 RepID=A0A9D4A7N9_9ROSI|nr:hypothetical protein J1N35_019515 [Gossypium stocksii]